MKQNNSRTYHELKLKLESKIHKVRKVYQLEASNNKLAPYGTDSRLFATDVCANFKVT